LLLTWQNTRYLVKRLRRLGRVDDPTGEDDASTPLDDLDRIEREVIRLKEALNRVSAEAAADRVKSETRLHQQATLLAATIRGASAQLDEVRLPLHILLDARFGVLNENQEELLAAARAGSDGLEAAMRRLATVADADRDALVMRPEPVAINDVVRAVLPMVRASAERRSVRLSADLEPGAPRAWADRAALAEAVALLATRVIETIEPGVAIQLSTRHTASHGRIRLEPVADREASIDIVASRVLQAQGITVEIQDGGVEIAIPRVMS
jgi:hypothetical protein